MASAWHTVVVLAVLAAWGYRGKVRMDRMGSLTHSDHIALYTRTILFEWLVLALVLLGVWLSGASLLTVLGERWRSARHFFRDAGIGLLFLVAAILVTSITGSHGSAGDKITQFLLPQGRGEFALWVVLSITAGICEEAIYRGYLQKQFIALTRNVPAGIVLSALAFGAAHAYQGFGRAATISVLGAMGGTLAYWYGSVRPGMIAHALQDVLGGLVRH